MLNNDVKNQLVSVSINYIYRKKNNNLPNSNGWPNRAIRSLNAQTNAKDMYSFQNVAAIAANRDGRFDLASCFIHFLNANCSMNE